jgi:ankyrin repeat protein
VAWQQETSISQFHYATCTMASSEEYIITQDDLDYGEWQVSPFIRAARNPNINMLKTLWENRERMRDKNLCDHYAGISAYNEAIKGNHPEHYRFLLSIGKGPDLFPPKFMIDYAARFRRILNARQYSLNPPNAALEETIPRLESEPLSEFEMHIRSQELNCRFWAGHRFWNVDRGPIGGNGYFGITPVEVASKVGSIELLNIALASGTDITFWTEERHEIPDPPTVSSLSVSTPLLCAVQHRHTNILRHLLDYGLNPNVMPLVTRSQTFSPLMATILLCDPPNWDAYDVLIQHPKTDFDLVTPIMKIGLLHFAVARLCLSTVKRVLQTVPLAMKLTALGHNLLHIACMPLTSVYVNIWSKAAYTSATDSRSMDFKADYITRQGQDGLPERQAEDYLQKQSEVILFLQIEYSDFEAHIATQDYKGNTPLHYLASQRIFNIALVENLRTSVSIEKVWTECKNKWSYTPADILEDSEKAVFEDKKPFWGRRKYAPPARH